MKFTQEELNEIVRKHELWLKGIKGGSRAVLNDAVLTNMMLTNADLCGAILANVDLTNAVLANAVLTDTDLTNAVFTNAVLTNTDFRGADLTNAVFTNAALTNANFRGADLTNVVFTDRQMARYFPLSCPEYGSFIGWKKASGQIIKLQITDDAKRCSAFGRKCRCSKAVVLAIENFDGTDSGLTEISSNFDQKFVYKVGETVEVKGFDDDRKHECSAGIHFFITRQEAVVY